MMQTDKENTQIIGLLQVKYRLKVLHQDKLRLSESPEATITTHIPALNIELNFSAGDIFTFATVVRPFNQIF